MDSHCHKIFVCFFGFFLFKGFLGGLTYTSGEVSSRANVIAKNFAFQKWSSFGGEL